MNNFSLVDDLTGINCGIDENGLLFFDNQLEGYRYTVKNNKKNREKLLEEFNNLTAINNKNIECYN